MLLLGISFINSTYGAIIDIDKSYKVTEENILCKCGWSPFLGKTFPSSIYMTIVDGNLAFEHGTINPDIPYGMQLEFDRSITSLYLFHPL